MKNIGVIGCGRISQVRHLPEYAQNQSAVLCAYFDFNKERASEMAALYGGKAYDCVDELLAAPEIDAVSVCVANNAHAEISIKALEAGKDVLCEKPMATTLADCEAMVEAAKKAGKVLMIDLNQRLTNTHVAAKKLIADGAIGDVISFRTTFGHGGPETWSVDPGSRTWFFDKKLSAMGAMADLGVHKTDLIQYLLGQRVIETTARLVTLDKKGPDGAPISVDDNAICIYKTSGGAIGTMTASWTHYGDEDNTTVIYGTKGIMRIYVNPDYSIEIVQKDGKKILYEIDKMQRNDDAKQESSHVIDAFIDCIEGRGENVISGEDVLAAMRVVFASIDSSERGAAVEIEANR